MKSGIVSADSLNITGEIIQEGIANKVDITVLPAPKQQKQSTNQHNITVTQTGKNNSVKINSR